MSVCVSVCFCFWGDGTDIPFASSPSKDNKKLWTVYMNTQEKVLEGSGAWARGGEAPGTLIRICPVSQAWIDRKATGAHSKPPGEPLSGQRMGEDAAQQDRALGQESFSSEHSEKAVGPPRPSKGVVGSIGGQRPHQPC